MKLSILIICPKLQNQVPLMLVLYSSLSTSTTLFSKLRCLHLSHCNPGRIVLKGWSIHVLLLFSYKGKGKDVPFNVWIERLHHSQAALLCSSLEYDPPYPAATE